MSLISWKDEYNTGLADIDADHQQVADMINRLNWHMADKEVVPEVVEKTFLELEAYVRRHFAREEAILEKIAYAGLPKQKSEHAGLIKDLETIRGRWKMGERGVLDLSFLLFLASWWTKHIMGDDMLYVPQVKKARAA